MNIHEYQAKSLFREFQIPVPNGKPAFSADEAATIAKDGIQGPVYVVKAQIHAG
ncbi:MAG: succinate--CoA ligase subunit beta, partial [Nitrospirae bacterium]|nr:succinate--CoA ligase subunit beta [Nitrospirota bacterium]